VAFALPSQAAWVLKQKDNGSAVYIDPQSVELPIGPAVLHVHVTSLSANITHYVVSHKKGRLKKVYAVANGTFTSLSNAPVYDFLIAAASTNAFVPLTSGSNHRLVLLTTSAGLATSLSVSEAAGERITADVEQGGTIAIYTRTQGVVNNGVTFSIVIE
jgi:hypothetical protein